jgi:hypothetical protein
MKHVMDYVVTHDKQGRRLVIATGCGRAELDRPWPIKRKPALRDAAEAVARLHWMLCKAVSVQPWDVEIGTITFEGAVHQSAHSEAGNGPEQAAAQPKLEAT